jgi:hypothetical protein
VKWESAALIKFPAENGLHHPKLTVTADGQLMVSAAGGLPRVTLQSMAWFSRDGRTWGEAENLGEANYWFGRVTWHKGTAYSYGYGTICGIAQTIQINSSKDGKPSNEPFQQTFSGFFPKEAALVFDGDTGYCLMSRIGGLNKAQAAYLGRAKAPYTRWEWQELNTGIYDPNLIRLPDGRIVAAVGLSDQRPRTSLGELDPATGKLTEFFELPTGGEISDVGLVLHDGHLWVSHHTMFEGKSGVYLAKVKLGRR